MNFMDTQEICAMQEVKTRIEKNVLAYCIKAGLFVREKDTNGSPQGSYLVSVAVSGGADSMALLHVMRALAPKLGIQVSACHVNHGLRGAAADRDEAFVRQQCEKLEVPLTVYSAVQDGVEVPANAGEEWARTLRYRYFEQELQAGAQWIATAHTGNDQAETLLFRLARGTGAHGAAGIRAERGCFVRPMLCLSRQDTEDYCAAQGQDFVTDETNLSAEYARNRIRQEVVPALQEVNSAAVRNLCGFCDKMRRIDAYFSAQAESLLQKAADHAGGTQADGPWSVEVLRSADTFILETALHQLITPVRDAEEKYVRLLQNCVESGGAVQLRDRLRFVVKKNILVCEHEADSPKLQADTQQYPFEAGKYLFYGGFQVEVILLSRQELENIQCVHKKDLKNLADYAKIPMLASLRTRKSGDRFRQAGRGGSKSLKKLYNEEGLSPVQRQQMPLAASENQVIWLWNHGFAEGLAPDEQTKRFLLVKEQYREEGINK